MRKVLFTSKPVGRLPLVLVGLCADPSSTSDWVREPKNALELLAVGEAPKEFEDP